MAVDGGNAIGEAPVAHAVGDDGPDVERSTDLEMLRQFRPSGMFYAHVGPTEVVDGVPVIADQGLNEICIRNRARAHARRLHARYEALPGFVDVLADNGAPTHAGARVAEVHGDPFFGNQGPRRRLYEVMSFCNEVILYQVPLHLFHRLVYTNDLMFPVRGTETFEAAANSYCRLLRNWPEAVFLARSVATDLAVPIGHEAGLAEYLDQLTLVAAEDNDAVDEDRSPRMSELPNPFRVPMLATDHRRAADTRFFRGRGLLPMEWSAEFLRATQSSDLSLWLPPVPDWEPKTVWGPRDTGAGCAPCQAGAAWARSSQRTDLDNPSGARIGGGGGLAVETGTRPGGRAGTPSSGVVAGRAGMPRQATRGLCGGRGSHSWKGRGPSAVDSTPPGAVPKYPNPGQQENDLSRSRGDRIWSGAGLFPSGFPKPRTTCLNFLLWRDLSVWRIWGGYFGRRRSGWGGVY